MGIFNSLACVRICLGSSWEMCGAQPNNFWAEVKDVERPGGKWVVMVVPSIKTIDKRREG